MKPVSDVVDQELVQRAGVALSPTTKITPMLRQWLEAKAKAKGAVLLFRMGDFYELFGEDTEVAARVLDLAVTTRDRDRGEDAMPMAGFPHTAAPAYVARLIGAGLKVAICDQLEDPALAKGIVKRGITRMVTPGTVIDDESLDARANNYLVAVVGTSSRYGLAALDVSTGSLLATCIAGDAALLEELHRLQSREWILPTGFGVTAPDDIRVDHRPVPKTNDLVTGLGAPDPLLTDDDQQPALLACEMVLQYAAELGQGALPAHLSPPRGYHVSARLSLDASTRAHLDVHGPSNELRKAGTLLAYLDDTQTAAGGRRLLRRLLEPSTDRGHCERQLDCVAALVDDVAARVALEDALMGMADIERLVARAGSGRAGPRDVVRLRAALAQLPAVVSSLSSATAWSSSLQQAHDALLSTASLCETMRRALVDEAPILIGDEPIIRHGYDGDMDALLDASAHARQAIAQLEDRERTQTAIGNLKVRYNSVFGYYIEVTKTHQHKVPSHYRRKQTVATGERFVTDELSSLETEVDRAEQGRRRREAHLFEALLQQVRDHSASLLLVAALAADADASLSLALIAASHRWVRPTLVPAEQRTLVLRGCRHPVVEQQCQRKAVAFVPNDIRLDAERQLVIVTGPNMAGKSTLMRQVAVCQLLAQCGSYVPADEATLSMCDRIYTRVGANDDARTGRSTFMVEMTETAHILRGATAHSLVLLDEVGRGTSTYDGLSIAWAVTEYLHDATGARVLFATHYHELTGLQASRPRVHNAHVAAKEWQDGIVFLRTLEDGPAARSFGVQVAKLAGLPTTVVARAQSILSSLEGETPLADGPSLRSLPQGPQLTLFTPPAAPIAVMTEDPLRQRLRGIDIGNLTPLAALNLVAELVGAAKS
jgi:DNA mismatch repair protein MutS